MEITDEIKSKVFAQYWGQKVALMDGYKSIVDYIQIAICDKLILKPLSAVTDEDAIDIACKIGENNNWQYIQSLFTRIGQFSHHDYDIIISRILNRVDVYQYLQSNGYDLPQYLLGRKTLHEVGLAIYE